MDNLVFWVVRLVILCGVNPMFSLVGLRTDLVYLPFLEILMYFLISLINEGNKKSWNSFNSRDYIFYTSLSHICFRVYRKNSFQRTFWGHITWWACQKISPP